MKTPQETKKNPQNQSRISDTDAAHSGVHREVQERRNAIDMALGELLSKQNFTFYSELKVDSSRNMC